LGLFFFAPCLFETAFYRCASELAPGDPGGRSTVGASGEPIPAVPGKRTCFPKFFFFFFFFFFLGLYPRCSPPIWGFFFSVPPVFFLGWFPVAAPVKMSRPKKLRPQSNARAPVPGASHPRRSPRGKSHHKHPPQPPPFAGRKPQAPPPLRPLAWFGPSADHG